MRVSRPPLLAASAAALSLACVVAMAGTAIAADRHQPGPAVPAAAADAGSSTTPTRPVVTTPPTAPTATAPRPAATVSG